MAVFVASVETEEHFLEKEGSTVDGRAAAIKTPANT
jgi:hypothetical protein